MRIAVAGIGAVGARAARQLLSTDAVESVLLYDTDRERAGAAATSFGDRAMVVASPFDADNPPAAVILASPAGDHAELARDAMRLGCAVVSVSDSVDDVVALLDLDPEARERDRVIVVGAGFSPGLSCVLARHAASNFEQLDELHVAKIGTGGPASASHRQDALAGEAVEWRDGWVRRRAGSGRELAWLPDPIGGVDCYRAALPDPLLLVPAFPEVDRVTARVGAARSERWAARLPVHRRPRAEGGPGAVRIEARGRRGRATDAYVLGAIDRPALAAGAVAAVAAVWAVEGRLHRRGAAGLAELVDPVPFLSDLAARGVKAAVFAGDRVSV